VQERKHIDKIYPWLREIGIMFDNILEHGGKGFNLSLTPGPSPNGEGSGMHCKVEGEAVSCDIN
jgi:hypothetical protein